MSIESGQINIWLGKTLKSAIDKQYEKEKNVNPLLAYGTYLKHLMVKGLKSGKH
jgi:hypothetical protein